MINISEMLVPRETVNDDSYLVLEILRKNGDFVKKNDVLAVLETSKSTFQISSSAEGYIFYRYLLNECARIGEVFAVISSSDQFPEKYARNPQVNVSKSIVENLAKTSEASLRKVRFSKAALSLIKKHHLEESCFKSFGVVAEEDVRKYLLAQREQKPIPFNIKMGSPASKKPRLIVLGGGGHGKMCIDILKQKKLFNVVGVVDSLLGAGSMVLEIPVLGGDTDQNLEKLYERGVRLAINGVGLVSNHMSRGKLSDKLRKIGFYLPNLIHSSAMVEPSSKLGEGNQIMAGAIFGSGACMGSDGIINSGAIVSHDCILGDNVHVAPGAVLGGHVSVGTNSLIGMGVTIYAGAKVGKNVTIANGLHVFKDISDGAVLKVCQ